MRCWIALCTVLLPASGMALSQTTDGGFYHPVDPVATVEVGTVKVKVGQSGEMEIAAGEEAYSVESSRRQRRVEDHQGWVEWSPSELQQPRQLPGCQSATRQRRLLGACSDKSVR